MDGREDGARSSGCGGSCFLLMKAVSVLDCDGRTAWGEGDGGRWTEKMGTKSEKLHPVLWSLAAVGC